MIRRRVGLLVGLACTAIVLSGCDGPPDPTPSTTAPLFATEAEAFAAAEATYRAYVDALNAVDLSDPETFEPVFALTTGELNASDREGLTGYHASGYRVTGQSAIDSIEPLRYDHQTAGITLAVCLDVSEVELVDANGKSLVSPERVDVQSLTVELESRPAQGLLAISSIAGRDGEPTC